MPDTTSSMVETLEQLDAAPRKPTTEAERFRSELLGTSEKERPYRAFEMIMQGIPIASIAKMFGVDISTVYRWKAKHASEYREMIEDEPAANLIADHLLFLQKIEEVCLYEAQQLGKDSKKVDVKTGGVIEAPLNSGGKNIKHRFLVAALKARQMQMDLQQNTGILPTEPSRIYHSMADDGKIKNTDKKRDSERTDEELVQDVLESIAKGRKLE